MIDAGARDVVIDVYYRLIVDLLGIFVVLLPLLRGVLIWIYFIVLGGWGDLFRLLFCVIKLLDKRGVLFEVAAEAGGDRN